MTSITSELLIHPSIVRKNIVNLKNRLKGSSNFMAIIKSDAYGHILSNIVNDIDDICLLYTSTLPARLSV